MPSKNAHESAALENQQVIDYLLERVDDFPQWVVTVAFYKALHVIEAVFAGDVESPVQHTDDHKYRNRILKTTNRYRHLWKHYRPLFEASLIARYLRENDNADTHEVFSQYMPPQKVKELVLGHYLHQIQNSARKLLNDKNFLSGGQTAHAGGEE
jgi:hypothetical protein